MFRKYSYLWFITEGDGWPFGVAFFILGLLFFFSLGASMGK